MAPNAASRFTALVKDTHPKPGLVYRCQLLPEGVDTALLDDLIPQISHIGRPQRCASPLRACHVQICHHLHSNCDHPGARLLALNESWVFRR